MTKIPKTAKKTLAALVLVSQLFLSSITPIHAEATCEWSQKDSDTFSFCFSAGENNNTDKENSQLRSGSLNFSCEGSGCGGFASTNLNLPTIEIPGADFLDTLGEDRVVSLDLAEFVNPNFIGESQNGLFICADLSGLRTDLISEFAKAQATGQCLQRAAGTVAVAGTTPWTFTSLGSGAALGTAKLATTVSLAAGIAGPAINACLSDITNSFTYVATVDFANGLTCSQGLEVSFNLETDEATVNTDANASVDYDLCEQAGPEGSPDRIKCEACQGSKNDPNNPPTNNIWTAVGCVPTSKEGIVGTLITLGVSLAGGLALLLILYGAFTVTTSQNNPEKLKQGQEIITAAIAGLLFILFSVVLLQFIGIEILRIPGFGN